LSANRLNQHTFVVFNCLFHEFINLFGDLFSGIEQSLLLVVLPVQCQVKNTDGFPKVTKLRASCIDDSGDFVGDYELEILHTLKKKKDGVRNQARQEIWEYFGLLLIELLAKIRSG